MKIKAITESWFANELIPVIQGYASAGAKKLKDFVSMAMRNREKTVASYLSDISTKEWKELQSYLESGKLEKKKGVNITHGMARSMGRGTIKTTCPKCNMTIPRYTGGYPISCPSCDAELNYGEDVDALLDMSKSFISEYKDIRYLGVIGEKTFITFNNRVHAFRPLNCSFESFVDNVIESLDKDSSVLIGYLLKHAVVENLDRKIISVEESIVDKRIMDVFGEKVTIDGFWSTSDGKKIKKLREVELENLQEEEKKDLEMSLVSSMLEINMNDLLNSLLDIKHDNELLITTAYFMPESDKEALIKVEESLSMKYTNTVLIPGVREDEGSILLVY